MEKEKIELMIAYLIASYDAVCQSEGISYLSKKITDKLDKLIAEYYDTHKNKQ